MFLNPPDSASKSSEKYSIQSKSTCNHTHPNVIIKVLVVLYQVLRLKLLFCSIVSILRNELSKFSILYKVLKVERSIMEDIDVQVSYSPIDVTLELTRECPLNCLICSSNGGKPHPLELSLDKWLKIIDKSIELGVKSFFLSGGEPFSRSYFKDICKYIANKNVSLSIYTSGNFFDGRELGPIKYDDLIFISSLDSVRLVFGLEGACARTHDLMTRVKGSFNNIISSIRTAVDLGLYTELHFVPTKMNYKELPDVVSFAKKLGVKKVSVLRFVAQGRGKDNESMLRLGKDDLINLRNILYELSGYGDYVRIGSPFNPFLLSKGYKCTAGRKRMTIRYDGRVVPCEAMKFMAEDFNDNDVRIFSLRDIWQSSEIFKMARSYQIAIGSECNSCDYLNICMGGCPAQKLLNGALDAVDPYCSIRIGVLKIISI